ncbi:MAG: hypothetical protein ACPGVS_05180 [Primorskyibacter sp.]
MPQTKIATCHYCGTRAALVLTGSERHELSCSNCGAPLHDLKQIKAPPKAGKDKRRRAADITARAAQTPWAGGHKSKPGPLGEIHPPLDQILGSPLGRKAAKKAMKAARKRAKGGGLRRAAKLLGDLLD